MRKNWRYVVSAFLVIWVVLAFIFFKSFLTVNFVQPLQHILWPLIRTLQTVDQKIFWTLLILAGAYLVIRLVLYEHAENEKSAYPDHPVSENRVTYWESIIHSARKDTDNRVMLEKKLKLFYESITESVSDSEIGNNSQMNSFQNKMKTEQSPHLLSRFKNNHKQVNDFDKDLNQLLISMETKLEIHHEQNTNRDNEG